MKLLEKVKSAGYSVTEHRLPSGMRSIYINGKDAWVMCRIKPGPYSEIKEKVKFLQRSVTNLLLRKEDEK